MKVSVVVPTLNEEKNIEACLDSLRAQDFEGGVEIIVADSYSADETVKIAEKLADKVVLVGKKTVAAGRQAGAEAASGDVIVFTDADAVFPKDWLSGLAKHFEDEETACVYGGISLKEANRVEGMLARLLPYYFKATHFLGVHSGAGSNLAVRKKHFHEAGGFDTDMATAEDLHIQRKLRSKGKIVFHAGAVAYVSPRRLRKWGYLRFIAFHASNWLRHALGRKTHRTYAPVR